jgi:hypothetical protein
MERDPGSLWLTVAQVRALVSSLSFARHKRLAAGLLRSRVVDAHRLLLLEADIRGAERDESAVVDLDLAED